MIPRHRPEFGLVDLIAAVTARPQPDVAPRIAAAVGRTAVRWVPSGRAGLALALSAARARYAIVPAFNCWAVMEALRRAGIEPLFVDVQNDLNSDPDELIERLREAPAGTALILTHQFGIPVAGATRLLNEAGRAGVVVIEDGAAAVGASTDAGPVGGLGSASILSFQYTKSVFAGEGGLLLATDHLADTLPPDAFSAASSTSSAHQWIRMAALTLLTHPSVYGSTIYRRLPPSGTHNEVGAPVSESLFEMLPSRWMRELAARTWSRLHSVLAARRRIARAYLEGLSGLPIELIPSIAEEHTAPIRFPMLVESREAVIRRCAEGGIDLGRSFAYTCTDQHYPRAAHVADRIVNLPLSARLEGRVPEVIDKVRKAVAGA